MKRAVIPLFSLVALIFAVGATLQMKPERKRMDTPFVPASAVFRDAVTGVGIAEPMEDFHYLRPAFSGLVERVFVHVGQTVRAGQPLVQLDTTALKARLASAQAEVVQCATAIERARADTNKSTAALAEARTYLRSARSLADARAISREELIRRESAAAIAAAELQATEAGLAGALASLELARSSARIIETDLARSVVKAPIDGVILRIDIHAGEYFEARAAAVDSELVLGGGTELRLRVSMDEEDAWRWRTNAAATALVRGNPARRLELSFLRLEPMILPKRNLTGNTAERVDTRVLQALYRISSPDFPVLVGQQFDVSVEVR
jgi:HlyD family secretion protein